MTLVLADNVGEITTTTGTGAFALDGAIPGYQTFQAIGDTNTTFYGVKDITSGEWEVGEGTYDASLTLLDRTTVLSSSAGGTTKISFSAGVKHVFCTQPAEKALSLPIARQVYGNSFDGSADLDQVISSAYGGTGNGFTKFMGPSSTEKEFTLPDDNATLLYSGGALGTPSSGTVTHLTGTADININGTVGATTPTTGAFTKATLSATNSTTTGGGQLYLNGTGGSRIDFSASGSAFPAYTTRSLGTKIVLYPWVDATHADYAVGIASNTLWHSIPTSSQSFTWYAGTSNVATLSGYGKLTVEGGVCASLPTSGYGQLVSVAGAGSAWYNTMLRNDGSNCYLLSSAVQSTKSAASAATYNAFRPFTWNLATGGVAINSGAHGATVISGSTIALNAAVASNSSLSVGAGLSVGADVALDGQAPRAVYAARNLTPNTAGSALVLTGGGATVGATDKDGGYALLAPGVSTGIGEGSVYLQGNGGTGSGTTDNSYHTVVQVTNNRLGFYGVTPVSRASAPTAATAGAPAGGTGTAAGGWDTAANRNTAIAAINNLMTRVAKLENIISNLGLSA